LDRDFHTIVRTRSGAVLVRSVRPDDKPFYEPGLREYSSQALTRRFLASRSRFTAAELAYITEVDWTDHVALVGVNHHRGVADARWIRLKRRPDAAEVGVFVGDPFQRSGLGRTLLALLIEAARERLVRYLTGEMWRDNQPAFSLVDRCGLPVDWVLVGSTACFEIDLGTKPVLSGAPRDRPPDS
jgi:GNAT superfamily N-acetyltransferase